MGKKPTHKPVVSKKYHPFVSVCTPTFNRRPFIPIMLECFRNQVYPKDRMEWIIVDDGTDRIKDLIDAANIPQIKYFSVDRKMTLGEKRNYMHKQSKGSIIVYMDDDDYYPPERVSHAVDVLMINKDALCAGSSEMYIYFKSGEPRAKHTTARHETCLCAAQSLHLMPLAPNPFLRGDACPEVDALGSAIGREQPSSLESSFDVELQWKQNPCLFLSR
jgi:glycosyltransferase involved in cell wall biosynthesis